MGQHHRGDGAGSARARRQGAWAGAALIKTPSGNKFGKTEAGTIWLDPQLTRPYEFYQFWLNTEDAEAVTYLKFFTFLDATRIAELEASTSREPQARHAQRELAREVTRMVHGDSAVRDAEAAAAKLFSGDVGAMSARELLDVFANVPSATVKYEAEGWRLAGLLTDAGVTASKGEAVRLISSGGIYVNGARVTDERKQLTPAEAIDGQLFVLRKGRRDMFLIRIDGTSAEG